MLNRARSVREVLGRLCDNVDDNYLERHTLRACVVPAAMLFMEEAEILMPMSDDGFACARVLRTSVISPGTDDVVLGRTMPTRALAAAHAPCRQTVETLHTYLCDKNVNGLHDAQRVERIVRELVGQPLPDDDLSEDEVQDDAEEQNDME
jgi:hypothetical protein